VSDRDRFIAALERYELMLDVWRREGNYPA